MNRKSFITALSAAIAVPATVLTTIAIAANGGSVQERPVGPCDIYAEGGAPCAAAHSTTRALYKDYNGPLYQVMRQSDGKKLDIGVVQPSATDAGGYADAAAQDEFCKDTYCWLTVIYDQSGTGNHLQQAPRGGFSGNALGGFNNVPMADWAPVTLMGHKVYGVFINQGMGLRWNDTKDTAVDDQAEGQYWVFNGQHFNNGCCFDYGNAETDSRDDGDGTMETTYYGVSRGWYYGHGQGPWVMTDQENNLVGCVNEDPNDKYCPTLKSQTARFITAMADGEPHHWRSMSGNAQQGELETLYDGGRIKNPRNSYDPMRKQGAILLGNGGDNSNGSAGTFYEGAMTKGGTFPTAEVNQAIQANVVAAGYDVQRLAISASDKVGYPNGLQTFTPRSKRSTSVVFVNTTGSTIEDLEISIQAPRGWKALVAGTKDKSRKVGYAVEPGQTVVVTFDVTSGCRLYNGDLVARADWTDKTGKRSEIAHEKVRNVAPVKINEFSITGVNGTDSFIELYNAGTKTVNISKWSITSHSVHMPVFSAINIPARTKLAPNSYYLLALSTSGLSVESAKGDNTIYVRSLEGISVGDEIMVGKEVRKVTSIVRPDPQPDFRAFFGFPAGLPGGTTTLWQPLPDGPVITVPAGSTNIPVQTVTGFKPGDKMAIGYGMTYPAVSNEIEKYEVVTITEVGKPGTQAFLAVDALPGDTNIKVSSVENISVGDKIRLDIDSQGHGVEVVTVKSVGTACSRNPNAGPFKPGEDVGTGLELEEPLKYLHAHNMPFSVRGTGISFEPTSKFDHSSNEPVTALIYALVLDKPLAQAHPVDEVVYDAKAVTAGYQGSVEPDQLYGGPVLSTLSGNITLRDKKGNIVDALNYGQVVDPWLAEGYHAESGNDKSGSYAPVPATRVNTRNLMPGQAVPQPAVLSSGRYPDGADADDNKIDFNVQISTSLYEAAEAGATDIVITAVPGLRIGDTFYIGSGKDGETSRAGLYNGTRTITRTVEMRGRVVERSVNVMDITLLSPLQKAHAAGSPVATNAPTPGRPNVY